VDLKVTAYLLYLVITVPLTVWVGRALRQNGSVFLVEVFKGDERLAEAVNQLLVICFYLLNLGYLSFVMSSTAVVGDGQELLELLSKKVGGVALVIGIVHFGNVWFLNAFRRRAIQPPQPRPVVAPRVAR
jgi:hypothetical protein